MKHFTAFRAVALVAVAGAMLVGVACSDDDGGDDVDATATAAASESADTAEATAVSYPLEVTDMLGRPVTIEAKPETVVTLSPTAAEFVAAFGIPIAGRSSTTDFPPEVASATNIGSAYQPNMEAVLALDPDLIVADAIIQSTPDMLTAIEGLGVPVVFVGAGAVVDVSTGYDLMGLVFGDPATAETKKAEIAAAIEEVKGSIPAGTTAVAVTADPERTLYGAKLDSWIGDLLTTVGVDNPAATQPDAGPYPGYAVISLEQVIQWDPTWVLAVTGAPEPAPRLSEVLNSISVFKDIPAVAEGRVFELDQQIFLLAPGPRVVEALHILADTFSAQ